MTPWARVERERELNDIHYFYVAKKADGIHGMSAGSGK